MTSAAHCRHCGGAAEGKCDHGSHAGDDMSMPWCSGACDFCKPQERPARDGNLADSCGSAGHSCDADEIAHIRACRRQIDDAAYSGPAYDVIRDHWRMHSATYVDRLLHEVDDLRSKLATSEASQDAYVVEIAQLRAKLAEANGRHLEAEHRATTFANGYLELTARAEAAESRAKEADDVIAEYEVKIDDQVTRIKELETARAESERQYQAKVAEVAAELARTEAADQARIDANLYWLKERERAEERATVAEARVRELEAEKLEASTILDVATP